MSKNDLNLMEKIVSLCKRRGFVFPGSEIYGGFAGFWDYGPLGVELRHNIKQRFWDKFVSGRDEIYPISTSIVMSPKVWETSGHVSTFSDPLDSGEKFNTMFKTSIGAGAEASVSYLRPETAQGMFVNFKNIIDSFHPKLPFGLAQIGKAFRNEITPKDFTFRSREFEQMEIEYFISATDKWEKWFENWLEKMCQWLNFLGFKKENIFEREVSEKDRAHYSKRTVDIDYDFPFGQEELCGLAYRGDFDLKAHGLDYQDNEEVGPPQGGYAEEVRPPRGGRTSIIIPHVIEPTFGVERIVLALLCENYDEDTMNGEKRIVLRINPKLAPVKAAVFPLLANKPELVKKAREVFEMLKKEIPQTNWDDIGNIGKRYRRQDEIGTPFCLTIDFDTLKDETLTIRARDTGQQERVAVSKVIDYIKERL